MTIGPVYTETTACQDCYRCLRHCPVNAIRVQDGKAEVQKELCLNCGRCLNECPSDAKKIRSDVGRVRQLLAIGREVVVSLAPSWVAELSDSSAAMNQITSLGFRAVEETAAGARMLADACRTNPDLAKGVSSACPVIVEYISRYKPSLLGILSPLVSPLEAHARSMKERYGQDCIVVFIGPCVAKKLEADNPESAVDFALTFRELGTWMDELTTNPESQSDADISSHGCDDFFLEGGFLRALERATEGKIDVPGIALSGLDVVLPSLESWGETDRNQLPSIELLACSGGCHNGPGTASGRSALDKRLLAGEGLKNRETGTPAPVQTDMNVDVTRRYQSVELPDKKVPEAELRQYLAGLGRPDPEDDPDCGSCGYGSCREFAAAVIGDMAEEAMCVSLMRRRAQNQSDALMRSLPLGAVIVDRDLKIRECNGNFLRLFTELDFDPPEKTLTAVQGRPLSGYLEDTQPFEQLLSGSVDNFSGSISSRGRIFRATIFPVGEDDLAGAVFQDITSPQVERETVIRKAEEVIQKSLSSVQQIASLLGENAADTQLILDSLIGAFHE